MPRQPVYSLICKRDLKLGETCFSSLLRCCKDDIELRIYSDGSLTPDDARQFEATLGERAKVIARQDWEPTVLKALQGYPNCLRTRAVHPMFCKLFDVPLHAANPYAYVDSDVLFLRPFKGLHRHVIGDYEFAHMRDIGHGDGFGWKRRLLGQVRPLYRCNAGFLFIGKSVFNLDFAEELFGRIHAKWHDVEQGTWGMLGSRVKAGVFSRRQVAMPWPTCPRYTRENLPVALHFIGDTRAEMASVIERFPYVEEEPIELTVTPSRRLNPALAFWDSSRKFFWRFGLRTQ